MYDLLHAESRNLSVKPVQVRKNGEVPGVVFSKDMESVPVKFREAEVRKVLAHGVKVLEVELQGQGKILVNLDKVQRDPVSRKVIHLSFHKLNKNQATTVHVPLKMVGTAIGSKEGGVVRLLVAEIEVTGLPHKIPEHLDVDVSEVELNGHLSVSDVKLPGGLSFSDSDLEKNLVNCSVPKVVEEKVEAAEGATEGEASETPKAEEAAPQVEEKKAA